jgi:hypothetical protein
MAESLVEAECDRPWRKIGDRHDYFAARLEGAPDLLQQLGKIGDTFNHFYQNGRVKHVIVERNSFGQVGPFVCPRARG